MLTPSPSHVQAALLGDMEGAGSLADAFGAGAAFMVLQSLVQSWLNAAMHDKNECAQPRWLYPCLTLAEFRLTYSAVSILSRPEVANCPDACCNMRVA